jgi:hypothetical protein
MSTDTPPTQAIRLGYTEDEPTVLPDGRTVRAKSSSRQALLLTAWSVTMTWSLVNLATATCKIIAFIKAGWSGDVTPVVVDFPWIAAVLVVGAMFAKDKPLDRLAEIAAALKR